MLNPQIALAVAAVVALAAGIHRLARWQTDRTSLAAAEQRAQAVEREMTSPRHSHLQLVEDHLGLIAASGVNRSIEDTKTVAR